MRFLSLILAQADAPTTPTTAPTGAPAGPGSGPAAMFTALMVAMIAFMLLSSRSQRKREQRERDGMFSRLAKNDRVLTVGGIIGTIVSVKDDEVVVKVDETNNTKMTFLKSAIQRILTNGGEAEKKS